MPRIFDNIVDPLLPSLQADLSHALHADFCVGYFNLRGWKYIADYVEHFSGSEESCCRVLVGMYRLPEDVMREEQRALRQHELLDGPTQARLRRAAAAHFRVQLQTGVPTSEAQQTLRQLQAQLRAGKVVVRSVIGIPLHAKLYLVEREDHITPIRGYVGSSNLTFAGLTSQGELNVDVVDHDATLKLKHWFNDRWNDRTAFDISQELIQMIDESWASERLFHPYHVYLKMAQHLSAEAQQGEREFQLPEILRGVLLDFQERAVSLAAYYLQQRGGVLLGDVVGLGKTLMATAVAKVFQEDSQTNTLVICPPKLEEMWRWYLQTYQLVGEVVSLGKVHQVLPTLMRYRLVIIDESHNLRNRDGKRYAAVREYIQQNEPRVMLLTATPYNKAYSDLSNQLRLFLDEDQDLHVRPERFFADWTRDGRNESDFIARYQTSPRSIRAFEQSSFPDDWRDLMRLFMVRRTRQFILQNYAQFDPQRDRSFVQVGDQRFFFPKREPHTLTFRLDESDPSDQYARLYQEKHVKVIQDLRLPRYGLANYIDPRRATKASPAEKKLISDLTIAGRRLLGFSRTNLFKRLESSGYSFLKSVMHHVLRNMITLHALEHDLPVPIGTQDVALFDTALSDMEPVSLDADDAADFDLFPETYTFPHDLTWYREQAQAVYAQYQARYKSRFKWLKADFWSRDFALDLLHDSERLIQILEVAPTWDASRDAKLYALDRLLVQQYPAEKVLVFTQFADTARYLGQQLQGLGINHAEVVTGQGADPTALARRFSPRSNGGLRSGESELRVLIATDVLGEGQNLQDAHIVVNYDLPWAIVRLIQRAGRVDRIGQLSDTVHVYSFLPAAGIEKLIHLRQLLSQRLKQNQEVVGSDESFFDTFDGELLRHIYTEQAGSLDEAVDDDVDLASVALQVWNSASAADQKAALALPAAVGAARHAPGAVDSTLVYLRFPDGSDSLVQVAPDGSLMSQSLASMFQLAACASDTPALPLRPSHHESVRQAIVNMLEEQHASGGQLGTLRSTRRKVYERLNGYRQQLLVQPQAESQPLLEQLQSLLNTLYAFPLRDQATESLRRQLRLDISDADLAALSIRLHQSNRLCLVRDDVDPTLQQEPQIVCAIDLLP